MKRAAKPKPQTKPAAKPKPQTKRAPTAAAGQPRNPATTAGQVVQMSLLRGQVRSGPRTNRSQAHPGVSPLNAVTSRNTSFQPLPRPLGLPPYHYDLAEKFPPIGAAIGDRMVFHVVGDSGGVKDGEYQDSVARQMIEHLTSGTGAKPQFCYHVGDVVYFTGMHDDYYAQFYEPYAHYEPPIFSIPGNHDGEVDNPNAQTSLDGWVDYFMQAHPDVDPISKDAPRVQLDLPNVYWTLTTPLATIVGMYTNVPEHGSIESNQQQWVTNEFATAPTDRAFILALHHPIYSFDVFHSGSSKMADVLENAIRDTGRVPNLVLTGHVHNYQRIEQTIAPGGPTPFIVTGNGGYHNLHKIHSQPGDKAPDSGAVLNYSTDTTWGFVTLTVDKDTISGVTTEVDGDGNARDGDSFSYTAAPITLRDPKSVPTL
jgi:acid phosphatase type 7